MSTVASFYVAPRSVLSQITDAGVPAHEILDEVSRRILDDFGWRGSVMLSLLAYLDDNDVDIMSGTHDASSRAFAGEAWVFGREHRALLPRLDAAAYDIPAVARAVSDDVNDPLFDEPELAVEEGLRILHDEISYLRADEVLILLID